MHLHYSNIYYSSLRAAVTLQPVAGISCHSWAYNQFKWVSGVNAFIYLMLGIAITSRSQTSPWRILSPDFLRIAQQSWCGSLFIISINARQGQVESTTLASWRRNSPILPMSLCAWFAYVSAFKAMPTRTHKLNGMALPKRILHMRVFSCSVSCMHWRTADSIPSKQNHATNLFWGKPNQALYHDSKWPCFWK